MIDYFSLLWDLLTVVFTNTFISDPFFLSLIVFTSIFTVIYIFMHFFDGSFVRF